MSNFYLVDESYKAHLESLGLNMELIFKKSGIPVNAVDKDGYTISKEQYILLMNNIDRMVDDHQIIEHSNIDRIMMFVPPLFAAMCSKDGKHCFERISKYKKLIGPFILRVETDDEKLSLTYEFDDGSVELPRITVLSEQVLMVNIIRKATGLDIKPIKVASVHDYGKGAFEKFFGIKPTQSSINVLEFRLEDILEPFLTENNIMWSYLEPELTKRIKEIEIDDSFSAKVRSVLFELIPAGEANVESVAKELALSIRSLQRKLSSENTTFIKELNHTRELLARNYLKDKSISNDDIAFLIGYSEANAFQRAFRNWTGMTTGQYRKNYEVE
ncbi:AraC family transcriptional regulator [Vallitalea okinawensis]|uniref:AraC family transcriptional regulator n=1 Tax=Vallitalea okinawensis TaxID=2078660 RepID=UPI0013003922|nr:AraC family transcriptional regulator [Vallitalea okinawensis]